MARRARIDVRSGMFCDTLDGMEQFPFDTPRAATVTEVASVAGLLDAFNREFDTPTPGEGVLATRLSRLLPAGDVVALLNDDPAVAVALLTLPLLGSTAAASASSPHSPIAFLLKYGREKGVI